MTNATKGNGRPGQGRGWLRNWLRRGNAEFVALAFIAPVLAFCVLTLVATMQCARAVGDLDEAASLAARVAAQSGNEDVALDRATAAALACATHPCLENIEVSISTEDGEWATGGMAVLEIAADVRSLMPFTGPGHAVRKIVFTVERASP